MLQVQLRHIHRNIGDGLIAGCFGASRIERTLIGQVPTGYHQIAHDYALNQSPDGYQVERIYHPVGQANGRVVKAPEGHAQQDQWCQHQSQGGTGVDNT